MRYAHIIAALHSEPWFATEATLESIDRLLRSRLASSAPRLHEDNPDLDGTDADERPAASPIAPATALQTIAVVRAHGVLGKHISGMALTCGGCDYDQLVGSLRSVLSAPATRGAILHLHSPGGMATGAAEAYDAIRALRAEFPQKTLVAFVDSLCCSAAYYLAAACDAIFATRGAQLGCIGAMLTLEIRTGANEKAGIVRRTFTSATMKDLGNPDRERTPAEDSHIQSRVDYLGGIFRADMLAARPEIAPPVFETGLAYYAPEALTLGLCDEIVPDLAAVVAALS